MKIIKFKEKKYFNYKRKILIRDLILKISVGIHGFEKRKKQRVKFNDFIKPICLLSKKDAPSLVDETVMVSGWGKESLNGKYANKLMTTKLTIMSKAKCKNSWDKNWGKVAPYLSDSTICAAKFQTGACADCGGRYLYCVRNRKVF